MKRAALLATLSIAGLPSLAPADLRLPAVLGSHMVVQRSSRVPLWGQADPGEEVSVSASWGARAATRADDHGRWRLELDTPPAGGPFTIELQGRNRLVLEDVLSGEVWVCGGQSNMEWSLAALPMDAPGVEEATRADLPRLRLFDVAHAIAPTPREDCAGAWRACAPESVRGFSVVGFFFGRELLRELDVPVGLVGCNWGGTVAEAWTSPEALADFPEFRPVLERVAQLAKDPEAAERELAARRARWWAGLGERDLGSSEGLWSGADFDDSDWDTMDLPRAWESGGLDGFDGLVWFRRDLVVPERWAGRELLVQLGPIDDMDTAWLDGVQIGGLEWPGVWQTPREYRIPAELATAGRHVLAVRVLDTGGAGGMTGATDQMQVAPAEDSEGLHLPLSGAWRYRTGASLGQLPRFPDSPSFHQNVATALSNGMLTPIVPFGIRGAIWYQGESNRTRAKQYERLFPAMIADWRARWGRGDFPFYFVQIAPFGYGGDQGEAAELRDAQRKTLTVPNTGMAVTMDIGDPGNIHPVNKLDVGKRLARWALAKTYGKQDLVHSGPLYRSMSFEGDAIRLEFDHADGGLVARGGDLTHFTVAGPDRRFVPAVARIDGRSVLVSSPEVPRPVAVRYGWGATDAPNLFNAAGLPASSFRTDDWPTVGQ